MELKFGVGHDAAVGERRSNRTFMELKLHRQSAKNTDIMF